jgi:ubiquinone/menaquinone biosynthesis C-methylase UbiE
MTFHCLPHPQQILNEAARTLRPGGWMVIADVDGRHRMARPFEWFEHRFISPLTHAYTPHEYQTLMTRAGLTDFRIERRPGKENGFMLWAIAYKLQ